VTASRTLVFVGPSLPQALRRPGFDYAPPARRGDIAAAAGRGRRILLIDGVMLWEYPPSPSELLDALHAGTLVWGAASLGALRAVELHAFGMAGAGVVFDAYLHRRAWADDWLVVPHDAQERLGLSYFSLAYALSELPEFRGLPTQVRRSLAQRWLGLYCADRTFDLLLEIAEECGIAPAAAAALCDPRNDIKVRDSLTLLDHVAGAS
jgi:hypothetical protein